MYEIGLDCTVEKTEMKTDYQKIFEI